MDKVLLMGAEGLSQDATASLQPVVPDIPPQGCTDLVPHGHCPPPALFFLVFPQPLLVSASFLLECWVCEDFGKDWRCLQVASRVAP